MSGGGDNCRSLSLSGVPRLTAHTEDRCRASHTTDRPTDRRRAAASRVAGSRRTSLPPRRRQSQERGEERRRRGSNVPRPGVRPNVGPWTVRRPGMDGIYSAVGRYGFDRRGATVMNSVYSTHLDFAGNSLPLIFRPLSPPFSPFRPLGSRSPLWLVSLGGA